MHITCEQRPPDAAFIVSKLENEWSYPLIDLELIKYGGLILRQLLCWPLCPESLQQLLTYM